MVDGRIDLKAAAEILRRPLALDESAGIAVLGASASDRRAERESMRVGDFTLDDIDGKPVQWSSIGRKKKLLFAWASW